MQDLTERKDNDWEINIDGRMVSKKQLETAWRFYQKMQIHVGDTHCPLCECDFDDNDLFVCEECGELLPKDEKCTEHYDYDICKECCDKCREEKAYWEAVSAKVDEKRGK